MGSRSFAIDAEPDGYVPFHLQLRLTTKAANVVSGLQRKLVQRPGQPGTGERLEDSRVVVTANDALNWILENLETASDEDLWEGQDGSITDEMDGVSYDPGI